jgi:hypothetical protein
MMDVPGTWYLVFGTVFLLVPGTSQVGPYRVSSEEIACHNRLKGIVRFGPFSHSVPDYSSNEDYDFKYSKTAHARDYCKQ